MVDSSFSHPVVERFSTRPFSRPVSVLTSPPRSRASSASSTSAASILLPANDPFVITVGAVGVNGTTDLADDFASPWSSHGYTLDGFSKPELGAPSCFTTNHFPRTGAKPPGTTRPGQARRERRLMGDGILGGSLLGGSFLTEASWADGETGKHSWPDLVWLD